MYAVEVNDELAIGDRAFYQIIKLYYDQRARKHRYQIIATDRLTRKTINDILNYYPYFEM